MTYNALMKAIFPSQHIYISISRSWTEVYEFVRDPGNLSKWAAGATGSVKFAAKNDFGVLDHEVTIPNGEVVKVPFRVIPNGQGSELIFTLYQTPGMAEAQFMKDILMVSKDLQKLKQVLELADGIQ